MATLSDTAYPRLSIAIGPLELKRLYALSQKEKAWTAKQRIPKSSLLGTIVYLKCFQCLGNFPRPSSIPTAIVQFIASELGMELTTHIKPT